MFGYIIAEYDNLPAGALIAIRKAAHQCGLAGAVRTNNAQKFATKYSERNVLKHFEAASAALAAQYDTYRPFPDLAVNGRQTLGENIADVAGLAIDLGVPPRAFAVAVGIVMLIPAAAWTIALRRTRD